MIKRTPEDCVAECDRARRGGRHDHRGASSRADLRSSDAWEKLLFAARAGDREALGQILEGHRRYLLRVARRSMRKELAAKTGGSDLVQETFLNAQIHLEQFRGVTDREMAQWLRVILENRLRNIGKEYRTGKRDVRRETSRDSESRAVERMPSPIDPSETPASAASRHEELDALRGAIALLPENQRGSLEWHGFADCTFAETGRRSGCSTTDAHRRWVGALETLKRQLRHLGA
jgi:RNA polymerase sigma-70 factor, ECF subfamily